MQCDKKDGKACSKADAKTNLAAKKMLLRNLAAAKKKQKRNKNVTNA
jgi:hypothetical protein